MVWRRLNRLLTLRSLHPTWTKWPLISLRHRIGSTVLPIMLQNQNSLRSVTSYFLFHNIWFTLTQKRGPANNNNNGSPTKITWQTQSYEPWRWWRRLLPRPKSEFDTPAEELEAAQPYRLRVVAGCVFQNNVQKFIRDNTHIHIFFKKTGSKRVKIYDNLRGLDDSLQNGLDSTFSTIKTFEHNISNELFFCFFFWLK